jgi:hypothetical protein
MPDCLIKRVKKVAAERHTTLRVLMIDALERSLNAPETPAFTLRDASAGRSAYTVNNDQINLAINEQREHPFRP